MQHKAAQLKAQASQQASESVSKSKQEKTDPWWWWSLSQHSAHSTSCGRPTETEWTPTPNLVLMSRLTHI